VTPARRAALFAALCLALVALNPLTYAMHQVSGGLFPDSIAYLAWGKAWLASGALSLDGWYHADAGLVLPPLYPVLVALLGQWSGDPIAAAFALNTAAVLLATAPLLHLGWRLGGPVPAFMAIAVLQAHPLVLEFGAAALTEGLFVLLLALAACLLLGHVDRPRAWKALMLGVMAALLFFCRQIGAFFLPLLVVLLALRAWPETQPGRRHRLLVPPLLATLACAALVGPYAVALHAQTGQPPHAQLFRHHRYVVQSPAGFALPQGEALHYYAERRERRQLLPDASEMVAWAFAPSSGASAPTPAGRLVAATSNVYGHAVGNLSLLRESLGVPGVVLLVLTLLSPLAGRAEGPAQWARWVLPATILGYLGVLSLFTGGAIARYVNVIVPLALVQGSAEAAWLLRRLPLPPHAPRLLPHVVTAALASILIATLPQRSWSAPLLPRIGEAGNPLEACREHVPRGAPIYAFHPLGAYLLDGTYRIIPNDTLERVVTYAERTGVRHMVLTVLPFERAEMEYYGHAPWIPALLVLDRHDPRITAQCRTDDGVAVLYTFAPAGPRD
jgi:hypothetical protein